MPRYDPPNERRYWERAWREALGVADRQLLENIIERLDKIERKVDYIMAQDDDTLAAVQAVQSAFSTLQTDVATGLADLSTILAELQAQSPTPDPKLAQAISIAAAVTDSINTTDASVKAALAQIPATPPAASGGATPVTPTN